MDGGDCVVQLHSAIFLQLLDVHQHDAGIVFIHATAERIDNRGIHLHDFGRPTNSVSTENNVVTRLHQHHLVQLARVGILSLKTDNTFAQIDTGRECASLDSGFWLIEEWVLKKDVLWQRRLVGCGIACADSNVIKGR